MINHCCMGEDNKAHVKMLEALVREFVFITRGIVYDYPQSIKELDQELFELSQEIINRPEVKAIMEGING